MKAKMNYLVFGVLLIGFMSCEAFFDPFVTSLGKDSTRDLVELYKKFSVQELVNALGDINLQSDKKAKEALVTALGSKGEEDLKNLSLNDKQKVLDLAFDVIVPLSVVTDVAKTILSSSDGTDINKIISSIAQSTSTIDTKALVFLLQDKTLLLEGDISKVGLGTTALFAQVIHAEPNLDVEDLVSRIESNFGSSFDKDYIDSLDIAEESKNNLKIVMGVYDVASTRPEINSFEDIFSDFLLFK
ncbi:MAG: hypothetical protein ACRC5H_01765 [Treponemataceae bacterium]